jgi:hypothetical protein
MEIVETQFKLDNDKYEKAYGDTNGHPGNIDDGIVFIPDQVPDRRFKMIF